MSGRSAGAFLGGVLLGTAIGSVFALLLAPRSGRETRRLLRQSVDAIPGAAEEYAENAQAQVERLVQSARRNLDETINRLNETIEANRNGSPAPAPAEQNGGQTTAPPPASEGQ
jgi:gas vesicle protein